MANKNKQKTVNGCASTPINGSALAEDASRKRADILKHISEISQVSGPSHSTKFVPLRGPGRGERDRMMNRRRLPQPRNIKLVEDESDVDERENKSCSPQEIFDENAVLAGIRSMYGGRECSNSYLQQRWTRLQRDSDCADQVTGFQRDEKEASKPNRSRDVFARNVGMRAILKQRMEKKLDSTSRDDTTERSAVNSNQDTKNVGATPSRFPFIQDSLDPDFSSRQFRGDDNDDDFVVEHVGRITRVTPRQYLFENIDDADFVFSREDK